MRAAIPPNEATRLAKLRELRILDTLPEESFDAIVTAVSEFLHIPIAVIVFVDEKRQWFKAKRGIDGQETSREISFCAHTILEDRLLVSYDTRLDSRFNDNPQVTGEPNLRFYAGAPVVYHGQAVGTVCCADMKPRTLTESEQKGLAAMARQVSVLLESRSLSARLIESESRFSLLVDSMPDGLLVWNEHGTITLANQSAAEIYECSRKSLVGCGPAATTWEALGQDETKLLPPEQHPAMIALQTGKPQMGNVMYMVSPTTGATKSILFNCVPLFHPDAKAAHGVVSTMTDVTERKQKRIA